MLTYVKKLNRRFIVILDSDRGAIDYENKLANKANLIEKVESLGGEVMILRKREIENYYSRDAIQRVLGADFQLSDDFQIDDYADIKEEIKTHIVGVNFKAKNNLNVFNEMTTAEWIASAVEIDGETDLEIIINKVIE